MQMVGNEFSHSPDLFLDGRGSLKLGFVVQYLQFFYAKISVFWSCFYCIFVTTPQHTNSVNFFRRYKEALIIWRILSRWHPSRVLHSR
jgi:hypothetical protein